MTESAVEALLKGTAGSGVLTKKQIALALDGCEYTREGSRELFAVMRTAGLVAVFGASDDLMELRGAMHDEVGCYDGGTAYLTSGGHDQEVRG